jgi:hypothetical protein
MELKQRSYKTTSGNPRRRKRFSTISILSSFDSPLESAKAGWHVFWRKFRHSSMYSSGRAECSLAMIKQTKNFKQMFSEIQTTSILEGI